MAMKGYSTFARPPDRSLTIKSNLMSYLGYPFLGEVQQEIQSAFSRSLLAWWCVSIYSFVCVCVCVCVCVRTRFRGVRREMHLSAYSNQDWDKTDVNQCHKRNLWTLGRSRKGEPLLNWCRNLFSVMFKFTEWEIKNSSIYSTPLCYPRGLCCISSTIKGGNH